MFGSHNLKIAGTEGWRCELSDLCLGLYLKNRVEVPKILLEVFTIGIYERLPEDFLHFWIFLKFLS